MSYENEKRRGKRTYCLYYILLNKTNHEIIFTFFLNSIFDLKIIKIDLFLIDFILFFTTSGIFFNEDRMHQINEDKGSFNLDY